MAMKSDGARQGAPSCPRRRDRRELTNDRREGLKPIDYCPSASAMMRP